MLLELDVAGLRELAEPAKLGAVPAAKLKVALKRLAMARPVGEVDSSVGGVKIFGLDSEAPGPSTEKGKEWRGANKRRLHAF